jgi:5-methyltetrahydrofolate--homocysteine methyltransferase
MQAGLKILKPLLASGTDESGERALPKAAFGTVKGDLHDIGKDLVIMMLEGAGFQVMDLGVDVPPEKFIQAVEEGAQIIGISAMLTTTMLNMRGRRCAAYPDLCRLDRGGRIRQRRQFRCAYRQGTHFIPGGDP